MKITPESIIVASKSQLSRPVAGHIVIAGLASGSYYRLDDVGTRVWELIQAPVAAECVWQSIAVEFDVSADRCANDVMELLCRLADEQLIEVTGAHC
jgi:hypothetical protein